MALSDHLQTSQDAVGVDQSGIGAGGWVLMAVPLVVALAVAAGMAVTIGVFVAGSLDRRKMYWSICLAGMGIVVLALLLALSADTNLDNPNKILGINPLRAGRDVLQTRDYVPVIQGLLLGGLVTISALFLIPLATRRHPSWRLPSLTAFISLLLGGLFIAATFADSTSVVPSHDLSNIILVPERFVVRAYLPTGLFKPTSIAFDSEDRLYVASLAGDINVVVDADDDGVGDQVDLFTHKKGLALGLAISDDDRTVYISGGGEVDKVEDLDGDGKGDNTQRIVEDLPSHIFSPHSNNGIALGPDGRLYMTVGGTSNIGPEIDPLGGTILVSQTDGSGLQVYASGLRNPYDLAFNSDGILLASDNAPDGVDSLPPAELNVIREGGDYGYPDFFGQPPIWSNTVGPVVEYPDAAVPTGLVAYKGAEFPATFTGSIFLTLWGPPGGSKVVVVELMETETGEYRAVSKDFAQGFVSAIDVAVDSKGRLYVADHDGNQVYQISARGGRTR